MAQKLFLKYGNTFFSSVIRYRDLIKVKTRVMSSKDINSRVLFECLTNSGAVNRNQPMTPTQLVQSFANVFGNMGRLRIFKDAAGADYSDIMDALADVAPNADPQILSSFGMLFTKWLQDCQIIKPVESYKFAYLSDPSALFPDLNQLKDITLFESGLASFNKHYKQSVESLKIKELANISYVSIVREFFYMWESFRSAFVHDSNIIIRNFEALKRYLEAIASDEDYVSVHISNEMISQMLAVGNIAHYFMKHLSSTRTSCTQVQEILATNAYKDLLNALNQDGSLIQSESTLSFLLSISKMKSVTSRSTSGEIVRRVRKLELVKPARIDLMIGSTFAASLNPGSPLFIPSATCESMLSEFLNNRFDRTNCDEVMDMVRESYSTMSVGSIDLLDELISSHDASLIRLGLAVTHSREIVAEPGRIIYHVNPIDDQITSLDEVSGNTDLRMMHTSPKSAIFACVPDHEGSQSIVLDQNPSQYVDSRTLFINLSDRFSSFPTISMSVKRLNGTIGHPVLRVESLLGLAMEDGLSMFNNDIYSSMVSIRQEQWNELISKYSSELDVLLAIRAKVSSYVNDCVARWKDRVITDQLIDSQLFLGELKLTAEAKLSMASVCVRYDLGLLGAISPELLTIYQAMLQITLANYPFQTLVSGI